MKYKTNNFLESYFDLPALLFFNYIFLIALESYDVIYKYEIYKITS